MAASLRLVRVAPNADVGRNGSDTAGMSSSKMVSAIANVASRLFAVRRANGVPHRQQVVISWRQQSSSP